MIALVIVTIHSGPEPTTLDLGSHSFAVEPQIGDLLIDVAIDGATRPRVTQRCVGLDRVTLRCEAYRAPQATPGAVGGRP